jgi:hypothetical protein
MNYKSVLIAPVQFSETLHFSTWFHCDRFLEYEVTAFWGVMHLSLAGKYKTPWRRNLYAQRHENIKFHGYS